MTKKIQKPQHGGNKEGVSAEKLHLARPCHRMSLGATKVSLEARKPRKSFAVGTIRYYLASRTFLAFRAFVLLFRRLLPSRRTKYFP